MLGYGQQAGGVHPTGMHSCFNCYRPQTKLRKVMLLHLSVILFTGGGVSATPSPGQTPLGRHPPLRSACWDMVNKQAVYILLECILVLIVTARKRSCGKVMLLHLSFCSAGRGGGRFHDVTSYGPPRITPPSQGWHFLPRTAPPPPRMASHPPPPHVANGWYASY